MNLIQKFMEMKDSELKHIDNTSSINYTINIKIT